MRRALALARRGIPLTSPNPLVGCVLVKGGHVVGEGWHARYGGPHAEPTALAKAGGRARGATAYVNLEPCCHAKKKTPPCTPALIGAGVRRVVAGCLDANPPVAGKGLKALAAAGVEVTLGVLQDECETLNRPFFTRVRKGRPYVILKAGISLDGRIETSAGRSKWITSPEGRRKAHRQRARVDAILAGIGTVLKDDPSLTSHGEGRDPMRVVLDTRLRIPASARVLRGSAATVVFTARKDRRGPGPRRGTAIVRRVARRRGGLDLLQVLRALAEMGVGTVLVEGGPRVHTSFLEAGLVDEVRLFLSPKLLGGARARSFFEGKGFARLERAPALRRVTVRPVGPDFLVTGIL